MRMVLVMCPFMIIHAWWIPIPIGYSHGPIFHHLLISAIYILLSKNNNRWDLSRRTWTVGFTNMSWFCIYDTNQCYINVPVSYLNFAVLHHANLVRPFLKRPSYVHYFTKFQKMLLELILLKFDSILWCFVIATDGITSKWCASDSRLNLLCYAKSRINLCLHSWLKVLGQEVNLYTILSSNSFIYP